MRIAGLVLAGGQGRRLGGADKAGLMLAGVPLLSLVVARLGPQVEDLAVSATGDAGRLAFARLPVLDDPADLPPGCGPLAGVLAGLGWAAAQGASHLATVAVDTPFLPFDLVPRLMLAAEGGPPGAVAVAQSGGRLHPTAALWPVGSRPALAAFLAGGGRRMTDALAQTGWQAADFDADAGAGGGDPFANINTPGDLAAAAARMAGPAGPPDAPPPKAPPA